MKAVLVATIGTRDLMFQVSSGSWCNLGDDRMKDGNEFGEQFEVLSDLGLGTTTYRSLTQYILKEIEIYRRQIKPVILGKLLNDRAANIDKIYLVGTNQNLEVREREKDTLYTCELIKNWVEHHYQVSVEVIHLGTDETNPANFEQMFAWWRNIWKNSIAVQPEQSVWVCLKGGVGQTSEAARISGLSLYGERILFFEFQQNYIANQAGICSDYTGPFLGTNYLWNRTQQQALSLLERYDYAEALNLLEPYYKEDVSGWSATPTLLKAGSAWNQGEFKTFFNLTKSLLNQHQQQQAATFWWQAYEEAYLAVIRLQQNNTTEAMFHSFRAVEGLLYLWATETFPQEVSEPLNRFPVLSKSIICKYPALRQDFNSTTEVDLKLNVMQRLVEASIPKISYEQDFKIFWRNARIERNNLFHRIGGLTEKQVFRAWGDDINNLKTWETRILNCLNLVTGKSFNSLNQASLFAKIHQRVKQAIKDYQSTDVK